jgi:cyclophilin family peptidyl-prolyl cis-trans isomerase
MKILVAGLAALFVSTMADAQGGGGQQRRRPREPENTVAPIFVMPQQHPMTAVAPAVQPDNLWVLDLSNGGRVTIQLRPDIAPHHVERIKALTHQGFYNGAPFHRVIDGFMAQSGDPTGTGTGHSDLPDLDAEFSDLPHLRGAVAMARGTPENSANSQFYIMFVPRLSMDHHYTVFGRVLSGMNFVDTAERGQPPAHPTRIIRASIATDNVPPPTQAEIAAVMQAHEPAAPAPTPLVNAPAINGTAVPAPRTATPGTRRPTTSTPPRR